MLWVGVFLALAGVLFGAFQLFGDRRREAWESAALVLVIYGALMLVAAWDEYRFSSWMQEDWPAEWATVVAFALAAALGCARALDRASAGWTRGAWGLTAAVWLFIAGEEMSWGQRLLGFATPSSWLAHNIQLEANLHNALPALTIGGVVIDSSFLAGLLALSLGAIGPLVIAAGHRRLPWLQQFSPLCAQGPMRSALVVVAGLHWLDISAFATEATELTLGVAVLLLALQASPKVRLKPWMMVAIVCSCGLGMSLLARPLDDDPAKIERAKEELLLLAEDVQTHINDVLETVASLRHRTVHARVQWLMKTFELSFGGRGRFAHEGSPSDHEGDKDRRVYFLDPWNAPYWLYIDFPRRRVVVYSTGPDRRRDTSLHTDEKLLGDDLGVFIRWPKGAVQLKLQATVNDEDQAAASTNVKLPAP